MVTPSSRLPMFSIEYPWIDVYKRQGFPREQWVSQAMKLWKQGENVYLSGQQEDGTHEQTKYFRKEEYLPVNTLIELDDREFRVDSVKMCIRDRRGTASDHV